MDPCSDYTSGMPSRSPSPHCGDPALFDVHVRDQCSFVLSHYCLSETGVLQLGSITDSG